MVANKQAIITKEHDPSVETMVFNMDLTAYGKNFWEFFQKAREMGIRYVRARPFAVREHSETKNLVISYEDRDSAHLVEQELELLVLSTGLVPGDRNARLAKILKIERDGLGFFKEKDPLLAPLETGTEGIYVCGGAIGPVDISESVVQGIAASMNAVLRGANDLKTKMDLKTR
jgi:heterodisulfide reductase subunit A